MCVNALKHVNDAKLYCVNNKMQKFWFESKICLRKCFLRCNIAYITDFTALGTTKFSPTSI